MVPHFVMVIDFISGTTWHMAHQCGGNNFFMKSTIKATISMPCSHMWHPYGYPTAERWHGWSMAWVKFSFRKVELKEICNYRHAMFPVLTLEILQIRSVNKKCLIKAKNYSLNEKRILTQDECCI